MLWQYLLKVNMNYAVMIMHKYELCGNDYAKGFDFNQFRLKDANCCKYCISCTIYKKNNLQKDIFEINYFEQNC